MLIPSLSVKATEEPSDYLIIAEGSYSHGNYIVNGTNMGNLTVMVTAEWEFDDINGTILEFTKIYEFNENYTNMNRPILETIKTDWTMVSLSSLVWRENRTYVLPFSEISIKNDTYSFCLSLKQANYRDTIDMNKFFSISNGSFVSWENFDEEYHNYHEVSDFLAFLQNNNNLYKHTNNSYTSLAISPQIEMNQHINFRSSQAEMVNYTEIPLESSEVKTIHIKQEGYSTTINETETDYNSINAYYDRKSGLLLKMIEYNETINEEIEFQPIYKKIRVERVSVKFLPIFIATIPISFITIKAKRKQK